MPNYRDSSAYGKFLSGYDNKLQWYSLPVVHAGSGITISEYKFIGDLVMIKGRSDGYTWLAPTTNPRALMWLGFATEGQQVTASVTYADNTSVSGILQLGSSRTYTPPAGSALVGYIQNLYMNITEGADGDIHFRNAYTSSTPDALTITVASPGLSTGEQEISISNP